MGKKKIDIILSLVAGICLFISAAIDFANSGSIEGNSVNIALGFAFIALAAMWYKKRKNK